MATSSYSLYSLDQFSSVLKVLSITALLWSLLAYQTRPLDTLIFYFISWLVRNYYPFQTSFKLTYGFILCNIVLTIFHYKLKPPGAAGRLKLSTNIN